MSRYMTLTEDEINWLRTLAPVRAGNSYGHDDVQDLFLRQSTPPALVLALRWATEGVGRMSTADAKRLIAAGWLAASEEHGS